jgi:hypothetical protein
MICKTRAAEIFFGELALLNHRAHRAVEHDDAFPQERSERMIENVGHREEAI